MRFFRGVLPRERAFLFSAPILSQKSADLRARLLLGRLAGRHESSERRKRAPFFLGAARFSKRVALGTNEAFKCSTEEFPSAE